VNLSDHDDDTDGSDRFNWQAAVLPLDCIARAKLESIWFSLINSYKDISSISTNDILWLSFRTWSQLKYYSILIASTNWSSPFFFNLTISG
jgi:hypothetical protein